MCPVHDITVSNHPPEMCHFARNVMLPPREGGARRTAPPHLRSGAVIHVLVPPSTTPPRCRGQGHLSGAASPCGGRGIFDAIPGVVTSHLGQLRRRSRGPASRASRASGRPAGRPAGINHARAPARMHTRAWVRASSQGRESAAPARTLLLACAQKSPTGCRPGGALLVQEVHRVCMPGEGSLCAGTYGVTPASASAHWY